MIQILKDFETKSGDRKVHFSMTGRKEKVIAQASHAFLAFLVVENDSLNNTFVTQYEEAKAAMNGTNIEEQFGKEMVSFLCGPRPKYDYNALFSRGLPGSSCSEKLAEFPFYAAVTASMSKSRVRDIKRGKLFQSVFKCETVDHFKPIDGAEIKCSEEYAAEYSADTFRVCMEEYANADGHVALTDNLRVIINKKTAAEVKELGWEFDYAEYKNVEVDWELYDALVEVFPDEYNLVMDIRDAIYNMVVEGTTLPETLYAGSNTEKVFNRHTAHVFEDAVGFNENEMIATIDSGDAFTNFIPTEEELAFERDKYFMEKIREYIVETDKLRDEYLETEEVDRCARAMYEWYLNIKARC